jgi:hypothetical protein
LSLVEIFSKKVMRFNDCTLNGSLVLLGLCRSIK